MDRVATPRLPVGRASLVALALALLAAAAACDDGSGPGRPPRRVPKLGNLNAHVEAVAKTYPTDGTHRYWWPRTGSWLGNARELRYRGTLFAKGDPEGRCHCSGLTFEVFLQAWQRWAKAARRPDDRILELDASGLRRLQRQWFGASGDRATLHTALTKNGLGTRITDWEDAKAGDFVQLWRHSGSGHACVFRAWVRDDADEIVGLRYWSTQSSTNGVGEREERFGTTGSRVKRDELYVVRVGT